MVHAVVRWLATAVSTYILHVEHGDGYQWWSGFGGRSLGFGAIIALWWRTYNCHVAGCWRIGRHKHAEHGVLCRKHHVQAGGRIPGKHYELAPPGDAEQHRRTPDG